ncbi:c350e441-44de-4c5c-886f-ce1900ea3c12 [Thermothielavioides terrestris]|uniref:C350e441-44de-4c5c-886f-ce1900ea3c12 n=1 Tax=Thermothielavioides terrestris TaxID=2587410 RepID=A0A3S4AJR1_9PEZI|nr:c350e441-44de-4c5c-886f-ce1900ea3c12 [Thermothielavioides terrestris]
MGRNLLLLDFDGTITAHDTLDSLVTLAISATAPPTTTSSTDTTAALPPNSNSDHPNPNPNQTHNLTSPTPTTNHEPDPDPDESAADETNINKATTTPSSSQQSQTALWQRIVADYAAARAAHVAAYAPPAAARTTLADELAFLEALGPVEAHAVSRVSAAGFFRGLRPAGLRRLG